MANLLEFVLNNLISWIVILLITSIILYLVKFYSRVMNFPPGPLPLPLLGNMLSLLGTKNHSSIELIKYYHKYGPIITFWIGTKPAVFIFDLELARDAFKRIEFAGRPSGLFSKYMSKNKTDIIFSDYGPHHESLRRVAHSAVKKYAVSDKLAYLVCDIVDDTVKSMIEKEGINKPFIPFAQIYLMLISILTSSTLGKRYTIDDPEFLDLKYYMSEIYHNQGIKFAILDFVPILRVFSGNFINIWEKGFQKTYDIINKKYTDHVDDYNDEIIRDFYDSLICSKNEALKENKELAPYLRDESIAITLYETFFAGIDILVHTFKWILLLTANHSEMQNKMRNEIESVIGDRIPVRDDRYNCHYIMAFIYEVIRFRPVASVGVFHKTLISAKIGDQKIPAETTVYIHEHWIMNDPKYWTNPETFNPNRFLENDKFKPQKLPAFIPFGTGRRVCIGEKLAITVLFLILVRLLQSTNGHTISLINGSGSADLVPDLKYLTIISPKDYEILFQKK